jgi:hypothetical protein
MPLSVYGERLFAVKRLAGERKDEQMILGY